MSKKEHNEIANKVGLNTISKTLGANSRTVKRELIKRYRKHFTYSEINCMKKMSINEINNIIDLKVGKTK